MKSTTSINTWILEEKAKSDYLTKFCNLSYGSLHQKSPIINAGTYSNKPGPYCSEPYSNKPGPYCSEPYSTKPGPYCNGPYSSQDPYCNKQNTNCYTQVPSPQALLIKPFSWVEFDKKYLSECSKCEGSGKYIIESSNIPSEANLRL